MWEGACSLPHVGCIFISKNFSGFTAARLRQMICTAASHLKRVTTMSKKPSKHGPNKAKSIIAQPLFRSRQERAGKGKGSYRREAFQSNSWEASYFLAA
jgi:alternative ribosome-rescue factor